ncbi:MAG: hypothetical protein QM756_03195 [Polyangiaceae bacterium]
MLGTATPAWASNAVIEIDPAAESMLDARAVRRQVQLEVADIRIPEASPGEEPPLFVRVLGRPDRHVEVELWARGELSDRRLVSGAESGQHLLVRRVALAAAELAGRLRRKRLTALRARQREMDALHALGERNARRTFDGPFAVRAEYLSLATSELWFVGPSLAAELSLFKGFRVDLSSRFLGGLESLRGARFAWYELGVAPALRVRLSPSLDLDMSAFTSAALVHVAGASEVDQIEGQQQTWSARAGVALRLEPRLTRWLRLSVGLEGGSSLRSIPVGFADGSRQRLDGLYWGGGVGAILTPR